MSVASLYLQYRDMILMCPGSRGDVPQPEPEGGPAAPAAHQPEAAAAGQPPGAAPTQVAWPGDISLYYIPVEHKI